MLGFSVNTNAGAFVALQNLSKTKSELSVTQSRISTGLKVASTKDDSATFAIAQNLRADKGGLTAVRGSIDRAISTLDVAISAAEQISDILVQMKEKTLAATDAGLDTASRKSLNEDFLALKSQVVTLLNNAQFNGSNILKTGGQGISALLSANDADSGTAGFQTSNYTVANQAMSLGGAVITVTTADAYDQTTAGTYTAADAATVMAKIEASIGNVNTAMSALGSASRALGKYAAFSAKLSDVMETGIGNLVDADLARESARFQSLQVREQLGLQALQIANQSPQAVLSLFK